MASSMIHYIVSCLVAKELGVTDLNMFLIGAVLAPDTGNKEDGSYCRLLTWDVVTDYVEKAKELCVQEILAIINGGDRMDALSLFVPIHH